MQDEANPDLTQTAPEQPQEANGVLQVLQEVKVANGDLGGRPSVITEEIVAKLREPFMFGATDKEACIWAGISEASLYRYQAQNHEFREEKERWKRNPVLRARVTVYNNLNNVEVAKWYLERKAKDEFGARQEITGPSGRDFLLPSIEKTDYTEVAAEAKKAMEGMKTATP